jgi:hypothetical protein
MAREGKPQNSALQKERTKQYVATKNVGPICKSLSYWLKLILYAYTPFYGDLLVKMEDGDTLRSLLRTCERHKSWQINT